MARLATRRCSAWAFLICLLTCMTCTPSHANKHRWYRAPHPHTLNLTHVPTLKVATECPALRIAVINAVNFHFEVLASLLLILRPYAANVEVFLSPFAQTANFNGAWDVVRWFPANFKKAVPAAISTTYTLVFLVSTDYEMPTIQDLLRHMKPRMVVAYIHNAQFPLSKVLSLAPKVEVVTLSPHVSQAVQKYQNFTADWLLPAYPTEIIDDCLTFPMRWVLGLCLRGFVLQGKFSNLRRNYSSIWRQMNNNLVVIRDPQIGRLFHVNVLGKGEDRLALPLSLETHVAVKRRLMYQEFFNAIAHNVALIPSLANAKYYTEKFSSTVLVSLITGTPVLADEKLLQAYKFLKPDVVYMSKPGEEEVDTMLRIARMKAEDILKVRLRLLELRERLNQAAGRKLEKLVSAACDIAKVHPIEVIDPPGGGNGKGLYLKAIDKVPPAQ